MRPLGAFPDASWPQFSDYKNVLAPQAASTAIAADLPLTSSSSAPQYVKIMSNVTAFLRWGSTGAAVPAGNVLDGSGTVELVQQNWMYQGAVPAGTTGFSMAFVSSGFCTMSFYKK